MRLTPLPTYIRMEELDDPEGAGRANADIMRMMGRISFRIEAYRIEGRLMKLKYRSDAETAKDAQNDAEAAAESNDRENR